MQNYIFYFEDNSYLTFSLSNQEFEKVKEVFLTAKTHIILDETIISKQNVRYITKVTEKEEPESAVPEHLDQGTYEYLKTLERGE
jgi:hypothetical protein